MAADRSHVKKGSNFIRHTLEFTEVFPELRGVEQSKSNSLTRR